MKTSYRLQIIYLIKNLYPEYVKDFNNSVVKQEIQFYFILFFTFLKTGFYHIGQAGLQLLTSDDPPASASQSAGITGMSHHDQQEIQFYFYILMFFWDRLTLSPGWSAVVQSQLSATSTSWVQVIILPQPPE